MRDCIDNILSQLNFRRIQMNRHNLNWDLCWIYQDTFDSLKNLIYNLNIYSYIWNMYFDCWEFFQRILKNINKYIYFLRKEEDLDIGYNCLIFHLDRIDKLNDNRNNLNYLMIQMFKEDILKSIFFSKFYILLYRISSLFSDFLYILGNFKNSQSKILDFLKRNRF
jgi:hypothetical protein